MSFGRYLRRRIIVKYILIGLIAYTLYISLAAFGTIGGVFNGDRSNLNSPNRHVKVQQGGNNNDYLMPNNANNVNNNHNDKQIEKEKQDDNSENHNIDIPSHIHESEKLQKIQKLIDQYDNTRNYSFIKNNGSKFFDFKVP